ncbi:MAG: metal-dependent transcriptional regulator [Spirochaetaceae bacterium]|nr:metal-dependent transcriptional regulator [Spirochaetaceae bacterium]
MYESGENYLETILMLQNQQKIVRSIDIARKLSVSKPSVSRAMGILKNEGYIDMAENGPIVLTEKGLEKAQKIYNRHRILTEFLEVITKVPKVQAEENACRIEHVLDEDVFQGIQQYLENQKQGGTK